jgi:hypothetical protein
MGLNTESQPTLAPFTLLAAAPGRCQAIWRLKRMKQRITLTIDENLLKKVRVIAARKGTSVSQMLSDHLKEIIEREEHYEAAKRSALQRLKKGFHLGGKISWKREGLYSRAKI